MRRLICKRICDYKSFDDEESVDGNRPSSAASAFKVPAPKKPGNPSNSARKPGSAGGPKVGVPNVMQAIMVVPSSDENRKDNPPLVWFANIEY
ncbi:clip-associating protein 2-like [Limosa lapponica baueri]|uniref:Clip-associating protein 2-like n=1 Tax=Limosa lapponica baueri TaxID=1758121 RepID=A0A2I0TDI8_LIMLA|nr:clip-associating protein 2-like [Limosa lapponica baueri]